MNKDTLLLSFCGFLCLSVDSSCSSFLAISKLLFVVTYWQWMMKTTRIQKFTIQPRAAWVWVHAYFVILIQAFKLIQIFKGKAKLEVLGHTNVCQYWQEAETKFDQRQNSNDQFHFFCTKTKQQCFFQKHTAKMLNFFV